MARHLVSNSWLAHGSSKRYLSKAQIADTCPIVFVGRYRILNLICSRHVSVRIFPEMSGWSIRTSSRHRSNQSWEDISKVPRNTNNRVFNLQFSTQFPPPIVVTVTLSAEKLIMRFALSITVPLWAMAIIVIRFRRRSKVSRIPISV